MVRDAGQESGPAQVSGVRGGISTTPQGLSQGQAGAALGRQDEPPLLRGGGWIAVLAQLADATPRPSVTSLSVKSCSQVGGATPHGDKPRARTPPSVLGLVRQLTAAADAPAKGRGVSRVGADSERPREARGGWPRAAVGEPRARVPTPSHAPAAAAPCPRGPTRPPGPRGLSLPRAPPPGVCAGSGRRSGHPLRAGSDAPSSWCLPNHLLQGLPHRFQFVS